MKKSIQREFTIKRSRVILCEGCPTVECTCFTELEADLLNKLDELIKACGQSTLVKALRWAKSQKCRKKKV